MSAPIADEATDGLAMYAPKRVHAESGTALPNTAALVEWGDRWLRPVEPFEGDVAVRQLCLRQAIAPQLIPEPPPTTPNRAAGILGRLLIAVTLAAVTALFMVGAVPLQIQSFARSDPELTPASLLTRFAAATPHNVVAPTRPIIPEPVASIAPADSMPTAIVAPPAPSAPAPAARQLDRDEVATLLKRGGEFIAQGDIAAARLMLRRAAETRDAQAALALGGTYDPGVLRKLGVLGFSGEVGEARIWYEKAAELGSAEAARRLEQLR